MDKFHYLLKFIIILISTLWKHLRYSNIMNISNILVYLCGASTELVAFCINHASAHKVTELYIVKDFSKIDTLNQQVIERIINYKTVCKSVLSIVVSLLEFRERVNGVKTGSVGEQCFQV